MPYLMILKFGRARGLETEHLFYVASLKKSVKIKNPGSPAMSILGDEFTECQHYLKADVPYEGKCNPTTTESLKFVSAQKISPTMGSEVVLKRIVCLCILIHLPHFVSFS